MKKLTVFAMLIFLAGCASTWNQAGGRYESSSHNFVVDIPQGWMELNTTDYLLISKDGPFLQYMFAQIFWKFNGSSPITAGFRSDSISPAMRKGVIPVIPSSVIISVNVHCRRFPPRLRASLEYGLERTLPTTGLINGLISTTFKISNP